MGFTLELLPDEPIMFVTSKGALTALDFTEMYDESRILLSGMKGPIYRIIDFRESTTSFMDLIRITQVATKGVEGSTTDPRIKAIVVGTNQWISLGRTIFEQPQFSAMHFPTLESIEDALDYAHKQLAAGSNA